MSNLVFMQFLSSLSGIQWVLMMRLSEAVESSSLMNTASAELMFASQESFAYTDPHSASDLNCFPTAAKPLWRALWWCSIKLYKWSLARKFNKIYFIFVTEICFCSPVQVEKNPLLTILWIEGWISIQGNFFTAKWSIDFTDLVTLRFNWMQLLALHDYVTTCLLRQAIMLGLCWEDCTHCSWAHWPARARRSSPAYSVGVWIGGQWASSSSWAVSMKACCRPDCRSSCARRSSTHAESCCCSTQLAQGIAKWH